MADQLAGNILVLQLECLSPVSNVILEGIISEALNHESIEEIYGSSHGFYGILNHDLIDLASQSQQTVRVMTLTPGAALGAVHDFDYWPEDVDTLFAAFQEHNIRFLLISGGTEAQSVALKLSQNAQERHYEMNVISIPDTIFNNLPITDHCLGYGSASKLIATTMLELSLRADSIANHDFINIIEVSAQHSDWLVASALLAPVPNILLLPSHAFSKEDFLITIQNLLKTNRYGNVVTTDALMNSEGNYVTDHGADAVGKLKDILEESFEIRVAVTKLGALPYCAIHALSKTDFDEAYACGVKAVQFALDGITGKMVTILRSEDKYYGIEHGVADLVNICGHEKQIPEHWFNDNGKLNANFSKYASPLIQGNVAITEENGLPKVAGLKS
jgi:6-phosphofructokinase 1